MNLAAGLYIGAWIIVWHTIAKLYELMFAGSAGSQSLGTILS